MTVNLAASVSESVATVDQAVLGAQVARERRSEGGLKRNDHGEEGHSRRALVLVGQCDGEIVMSMN
jgi:hypothetical protein